MCNCFSSCCFVLLGSSLYDFLVMASLSKQKQIVKSSGEYKLLKHISLFMDTFFVDPILGLIVPGLGDIITASLTIPFIYTSIFKLRSVPLTLAIVYNSLIDMLVGLIPVVGDIGDILVRSYKKNYNLIVGYVEDDPEVMYEIKNKALRTCVFITGLCVVIRLVFLALGGLVSALTPKSCTRDADRGTTLVEQVASQPSSSSMTENSPYPSSQPSLSTTQTEDYSNSQPSSSTTQTEDYSSSQRNSFDFLGYMLDGSKKYQFVMHLSKVKEFEYDGYFRYLSQPDDVSHRIPLSGQIWSSRMGDTFLDLIGGKNGTERFDIYITDDDNGQHSGDWTLYNSREDAELAKENYIKRYDVILRVQ